jgi:hypothetical protein
VAQQKSAIKKMSILKKMRRSDATSHPPLLPPATAQSPKHCPRRFLLLVVARAMAVLVAAAVAVAGCAVAVVVTLTVTNVLFFLDSTTYIQKYRLYK